MSTATVPLRQQPTPAAREVGLAVINRVLPAWTASIRNGDDAYLRHEAERIESQEPSPVTNARRAIIDAELTWRRHLARMGGRA